jgi:UDP-2,3-diacylglucosamine pyrophosphatase LpxH
MSGHSGKAVVIGDLHLRRGGDPRNARALVEALAASPDASIVFAGDALDLAAEPVTAAEAVTETLKSEPALCRVLADRASRGLAVTFVAGNHDAEIAHPEPTRALHDVLGLAPEHRKNVTTEPWFTRLCDGAVHVEHGHVFDPDGAPTHPLAPIARDDVGIAILRRFIVPMDAHFLVQHTAEAPLPLLMRVIRKYGPRAPFVIGLYIHTALSTWQSSGERFPLEGDREEGMRRLHEFGSRVELDRETLELLLEAHATPTRAHATATFLRLYLDRVLATAAVVTGSTLTASSLLGMPGLAFVGVPLAAVGALTLSASLLVGVNRYRGRAERALAEGAARAAEITGARTVILGHVHVDASGPSYRNTASFAFAPRHPYLLVEADGEVVRGFAS